MTAPLIHLSARVERSGFVLDVDLNVQSRVLGIVGPSGSGKSTLISVAAGLIHAQRCELTVQGQTWAASEPRFSLPAERRRVGLVPQEGLLFPHWNVQKNLACGRHAKPADSSSVRAMAQRLGIAELLSRPVTSLSGGQRQRVALGRALLSGARWLLLDEPLGALDYPRRRSLLPLLRAVVESTDIPLWFVSHDIAEVSALCDEVITIEQGQVVARSNASSLSRDDQSENLLRGVVHSVGGDLIAVQVGAETRFLGPSMRVQTGQLVFVSLNADDIMIATSRPVAISARNVFQVHIAELPRAPRELTSVRFADGLELKVQLAESTICELGLARGAEVFVLFKANACRVWADAVDEESGSASIETNRGE